MYQVKVLSDKEFEELPYPDMAASLGVADPKTNTAYVRYTGVEGVDQYLVNHELEHLIEGHGGEHSNHYRNGVYYKGFGEILQAAAPALAFIPGIGPIASAGAGIGGTAIANRQAKKRASSMGGGFQGGDSFGGSPEMNPMDSFKPASPNIVSPGSNANSFGRSSGTGAIGQMSGGGSPIDRVKGFFSSRNPQGGF